MIDVVLATHNGEKYLPAQLNSIAAQVGVDWRIIASDDGSTDQTKAQLERFSAKNNQ
ncbi:MAG: glycosyltransferase, partial [Planktomarina sp.]